MTPGFYGSRTCGIRAVTDEYPGINTPEDLFRALSGLWCADTCAPRMRDRWTPDNPTLGQCSVTAFLAQDIFGGRVLGVPLEDGGFHCFNSVDGRIFDLTCGQFEGRELCYDGCPEQSRDVHFSKEEKRLRYELLQRLLRDRCRI